MTGKLGHYYLSTNTALAFCELEFIKQILTKCLMMICENLICSAEDMINQLHAQGDKGLR